MNYSFGTRAVPRAADSEVVIRVLRSYEVLALMEATPGLSDLLTEAIEHAVLVFGISASLFVLEPDDDDGSLFLTIQTDLSVDEAHHLLDDVFDDWWLQHCNRAGGKLAVGLSFA